MATILNIINGDVAINIIKKSNIQGEFLAWNDFLHDGPVPENFSLEELSKVRANFLYHQGFGERKEIEKEFETRDKILINYLTYDKITLWFEHDLYDQLQLLQILAWFKKHLQGRIELTLISTETYWGDCSSDKINKLLRYEHNITKEHLTLASKAWNAFSKSTPEQWFNLLKRDNYILPFLKNSVHRMLEEYPNTKNGLSRSEHQVLLNISKEINTPNEIFKACQEYEMAQFMGDVLFWKILDNFIQYKVINSKKNSRLFQLTSIGEKLLRGELNWISIMPMNRWIGGVNLTPDNLWCWDIKNKNIQKYYYSETLYTLLSIKKK